MKRLLTAVLIAVLVSSQPALAQTHTESAFAFVKKGKWDSAIEHAKASGSPILIKLITWLTLLNPDSGADFRAINSFMKQNPNWPQLQKLQLRAEQSIRSSAVSDVELEQWFNQYPPISGAGKIAQARFKLRQGANITELSPLIRDGWINGDFYGNEEESILTEFANILTPEDHIARTDRLIWEEKLSAAERMLKSNLLNEDMAENFGARIALLNDKKDANTKVAKLSSTQLKSPGVIFARMIYRLEREDAQGAAELLKSAPKEVPYPEKWWRYREQAVRRAILEQDYALARELVEHHGLSEGTEFAEAIWLKGWLSLQFLKNPNSAYDDFSAMFDSVRYPVSKARAAYWAGRAAAAKDDTSTANAWYTKASAYPTTFYGQLAVAKLSGKPSLMLPADPKMRAEDKQQFMNKELVRAIKLCVDSGEDTIAWQLLQHMLDNADSPAEAAALAKLSQEIHSNYLGVKSAKRALQNNMILKTVGYPLLSLPTNSPLDAALVHAIVRQESEFDPQAESPSNARGLMQLLPSTAKEVARKNDIPYAIAKLSTSEYNLTLGSIYFRKLLDGFGGSYIYTIASYNAGPGRVREWIGTLGEIGKTPDDAIDWIERIPFTETRTYVQRVLENLQVYRTILNTSQELKIKDDLVR